jgi:hypothetical protein
MGLFGGSQTQKSKSKNSPYPENIAAEANRGMQLVSGWASKPWDPYSGDKRYAGATPQELQSYGDIEAMQGAWRPDMQYASQLTRDAGEKWGTEPANYYMNPYLQQVMDSVNRQQQRSNELQQNALKSRAASMGAFGMGVSSPYARAQDTLNRTQLETSGDLQSRLAQQGYDTAYSQFAQDQARRGQSATQLASLASQQQQLGLSDAEALRTAGMNRRSFDQQQRDWEYQQWQEQRDYDLRRAAALQQYIAGTPWPSSSESKSSSSGSGGVLGQVTGALGTLGGLGLAAFGGGGGAAGLGAFSAAGPGLAASTGGFGQMNPVSFFGGGW